LADLWGVKRMKRLIAGPVAALVSSLAVVAAPAAGHAQSLSGVFDQMQNAIVSQGAVVWEGFVHDSAAQPGYQTDWTYQRRVETSNFSYDLGNCYFDFHYRVITDGAVSTEVDGGVPFRMARTIKVETEAQLVEQRDARSGHPTWASRLQPQIYDVDVIRSDGNENVFSFYDLPTANHMAQLLERAASMCGVESVNHY
jgi:hypothetical protein